MWDELVRNLDDPGQAELQAAARTCRYEKGAVVFSEGDLGDILHVVASGAPLVEQALIGQGRPGATVCALTEATTRSLARTVFQELRAIHR